MTILLNWRPEKAPTLLNWPFKGQKFMRSLYQNTWWGHGTLWPPTGLVLPFWDREIGKEIQLKALVSAFTQISVWWNGSDPEVYSLCQLQDVADAVPPAGPQRLSHNVRQINVSHAVLNWAELLGGNTTLLHHGKRFIYLSSEKVYFIYTVI